MENEIVKNYKGDERAGTFLITEGFQREHKRLLGLCREYKNQFIELETNNKADSNDFIKNKIPAKTAGRSVEEYLLNEQ